jgi:hypothetical protein
MSTSREIVKRTGLHEIFAATAAAQEMKTLLVSFPPKPPPIRFIRTTTFEAGVPVVEAQKF